MGKQLVSRRKPGNLEYGSLRCAADWWCGTSPGEHCRDGNRRRKNAGSNFTCVFECTYRKRGTHCNGERLPVET